MYHMCIYKNQNMTTASYIHIYIHPSYIPSHVEETQQTRSWI